MNRYTLHKNKLLIYFCLLALLLIITATVLSTVLTEKALYQRQLSTQSQLDKYHDLLSADLNSYVQTIDVLSSLFIVNPSISQADFQQAVRYLVNDDSVIRNITAAPDMKIRYVYPEQGNDDVIGLDYRQLPEQPEPAERARLTGKVVVAGPLTLKQGGEGLILRKPVYLNGQDKTDKTFWGLISIVLDLQRFEAENHLGDDSFFQFAIKGRNSLGRAGDVFFGDPEIFDQGALTKTLKLPEGEWLLAIQPVGGMHESDKTYWQRTLIIYGFTLLIMIFLIIIVRFFSIATVANAKYRKLIHSSPVPYVMLTSEQKVLFINHAFTDTYGYDADNIDSLPEWPELISLAQKNRHAYNFETEEDAELSHIQGLTSAFEIKLHTQNNKQKVALVNSSLVENSFGDQTLLVVYDITVRKEAEEQLRFSSRVFNQAQEGIIVTETNGTIIDVNPAFCDITGYYREEVIGKKPNMLKSGRHSRAFFTNLWQSLTEHGYWQGEIWNKRKNNELYAELLTISALIEEDGSTKHYVGLFSDITHVKQQQETLELMAHYDVLTKLPNRVLFADRFSQAVAHCKRTQTMLAVCFLDLDNFKPVNDTYGHDAGDQLLIEVASRLKSSVREEDTISRFGGDEFAIIFRDIHSEHECEEFLKRIHTSLAQPYQIDELRLTISASSGVSFYSDEHDDLDTLLRHADQSMYKAKLTGRNNYQLFNSADNEQTIEKQTRLNEIREGLRSDQFCLFYQPKVNMRTGEVFGVEALIRWLHPTKGLIPPIQFLPLIIDSELEVEMGLWVVNAALDELESLHKAGKKLEVSVNISSYHLQSSSFIKDIESALTEHPGLASSYFQLEIVETSALGDIGAITRVLKQCSDVLGVSVALDDFGTGYSSLTHLRHLNARTIKIDQSFIRDMLDDPQDYTIVDGVTGLAESFNRQVIAEGVETIEHGLMLMMMGCESAQGYGIARPMPFDQLSEWLDSYEPVKAWLEAGKEVLSPQREAIKFLLLTLKRWHELFESSVNANEHGASLHWPILDRHRSHCGRWIQRVTSQQLFSPLWLVEFEDKYVNWQQLANDIYHLVMSDQHEKAFENMRDYNTKYRQLLNHINQFEYH